MSVRMLDDEALMNKVNPFVSSGPGTVRRVEKFSSFKYPDEQKAQFQLSEEGPLYSRGMPMGGPKKEPLCPMSRPLYPQRNIDTGFTDYKKEKIVAERVQGKRMFPRWMLIVAILIVLTLLIVRR